MTVRFKIVLMHKVMCLYGSKVVFKMVPNLHILCSADSTVSLNIVEDVSPHLPVSFFDKPLTSHFISYFVYMSRPYIL
jgi:hypothetical protein